MSLESAAKACRDVGIIITVVGSTLKIHQYCYKMRLEYLKDKARVHFDDNQDMRKVISELNSLSGVKDFLNKHNITY